MQFVKQKHSLLVNQTVVTTFKKQNLFTSTDLYINT